MGSTYENTVPAEKQVDEYIVTSADTGRPRILFVGNSITLHGAKTELGWFGSWGMAASSKEKDYVHQVMRMVHKIAPDASYMIVQAAQWEREYWIRPDGFDFLKAAAAYDADIIVFRLGENVSVQQLDEHDLTEGFSRLFDFFDPMRDKKLIVTDEFWANAKKDQCIEEACSRRGVKMDSIKHLGAQDDMMAIGLFEHRGVAIHPGDQGMLRIAEIIFGAIKEQLIKE